ncbi:MAG: hypothetical protein FJY67_11305, partial [Calditrichaeota bacterium]|nr:hypothetical protein [Calditrichota bacterium]
MKIQACIVPAFLTSIAVAQPPVAFILNYGNGGNEKFEDVYAISDGGYILCGITRSDGGVDGTATPGNLIVTRVDADGEIIWNRVVDRENAALLLSVIETDNGSFVFVGQDAYERYALELSRDGDEVWSSRYGRGRFDAVIELKDGRFLCAGRETFNTYQANLTCITPEGELIWSRRYDIEHSSHLTGLRELEGSVVAAGNGNVRALGGGIRPLPLALRVALDDGAVIWQFFSAEGPIMNVRDMTSSGDGGFVLAGDWWGDDVRGAALIKINSAGEEVWQRNLQRLGREILVHGIARALDGGFILAGVFLYRPRNFPAAVIRTNSEGIPRWSSFYNLEEDPRFGIGPTANGLLSVVKNSDHEFVATGLVYTAADSTYDGLLMKLEPDILGPSFIAWSPEDTLLQVLRGTEVTIIAVAHSDYFDNLDYIWS